MTREFTIDELDTLIAEACKPLHIVDGQPAIVGETSRQFVTYDENDGDTRIAVAAPDLAAFARRLLTERETVARLHRQQVERLEDDAATLAAERDALRATVGRVRPVVEALADGCRKAARCDAKDDPDGAAQELFDALSSVLGPRGAMADFLDIERALRALLADAPAEVPDV